MASLAPVKEEERNSQSVRQDPSLSPLYTSNPLVSSL